MSSPLPTRRGELHDSSKSSESMLLCFVSGKNMPWPARACNFSETYKKQDDEPTALSNVHGFELERSPPASRLSELGVRSWPKWGGGPGRMALSYGARQTCCIVRGKVAAVEGSPETGRVEFGAGYIVVFPRGTRCTWHIAAAAAFDMHYAFDPS